MDSAVGLLGTHNLAQDRHAGGSAIDARRGGVHCHTAKRQDRYPNARLDVPLLWRSRAVGFRSQHPSSRVFRPAGPDADAAIEAAAKSYERDPRRLIAMEGLRLASIISTSPSSLLPCY